MKDCHEDDLGQKKDGNRRTDGRNDPFNTNTSVASNETVHLEVVPDNYNLHKKKNK